MPTEEYYAGLSLAQSVRKLADHHADPRYRHISLFEYELLERAARWLDDSRDLVRQRSRVEVSTLWSILVQTYTTSVRSERVKWRWGVLSLPRRVVDAQRAVRDPTLLAIESALGDTHRSSRVGAVEPLLTQLVRDRVYGGPRPQGSPDDRPPEALLSADDFELVNRALYQPSVPVEQSPPGFESLSELVSRDTGEVAIALIEDRPVMVISVDGSLVILAVEGLLGDTPSEISRWLRAEGDETGTGSRSAA